MKLKKIAISVITILAALLVLVSGVMKFMGGEEIKATLEKVGVLPYRLILGAMEICFAILYLFKPTMRIGFILLTCYFSGALATELSHSMPLNALLPLTIVWISAFLRDKNIFLRGSSTTVIKGEPVDRGRFSL